MLDRKPDFVIEVISPNDKAADVEEKIVDYLNAGVRLLWLIYPGVRKARVFRPGHPPEEVTLTSRLDASDILPGFSITVADLLPPARR